MFWLRALTEVELECLQALRAVERQPGSIFRDKLAASLVDERPEARQLRWRDGPEYLLPLCQLLGSRLELVPGRWRPVDAGVPSQLKVPHQCKTRPVLGEP